MLKSNSRVIMVSGANRGIGKAVADNLIEQGYKLSLGARDPSGLPTSDNCIACQWDATDKQAADQWVRQTLDRFGAIDGLVLNAGVMQPVGLEQGDEAALDNMWDVNFKAPWRLVRAALPALRNSGHGRVINIVSLAGKRVLSADNLGYSASKFAALALTHAIRQKGWDDGVRATAICPGLVDTDMISTVKAPDGQYKIAPETIAATTAYALSIPNEAVVAEILVNSRLEPAI